MRIPLRALRRFCTFSVLAVLAAQAPSVASGRESTDERQPARAWVIEWQFGEPGHDPFSLRGEPGGHEEQNRRGDHTIYQIPIADIDTGNGRRASSCPSRGATSILRSAAEKILRLVDWVY